MSAATTLSLLVEKVREGTYFTLPFEMPENVERFSLKYQYARHPGTETTVGNGTFKNLQNTNTIDLGLLAPDGSQIGASGSDKQVITISETCSTPGYRSVTLTPGKWQILVGAYKVAPEGVTVIYELTFTPKRIRMFKGDLHTHTLASDGVHTTEELGWKALRHGLDYIAITDHNQMVTPDALPQGMGVTFIPGIEWTHYMGHANFLGSSKPYDAPFMTNSLEETLKRFHSAQERGALVVINHPFEEEARLVYDINSLPFDCIEIWNGPMRESNLRAHGLWHSLLCKGKKIPICGGSDYHRDTPFIFLGGPTTCIFAPSASVSDILAALKQGHAYITFAPNGPSLQFSAGEAMLGDSVSWKTTQEMHITLEGLLSGDVAKVITVQGDELLLQAPTNGSFQTTYKMPQPGFARVEVYRAFLPGLPMLPALISNPIYFVG